jgi:aminopeptidase N
MLRNYLGDDAFFEGLTYYLKENEFQTVEIHQLRLAFEKVSGQDLNWFFNQWFFSAGHPIISVETAYNDSLQKLYVTVTQSQEGANVPMVFKLPTTIEFVTTNGDKIEKQIIVNERINYFSFPFSEKPALVNFDGDKSLLAEIEQTFTEQQATVLFEEGGNYLDRYIAIESLENSTDSVYLNTVEKALNDPFWNIRRLAIASIENLATFRSESTFLTLKDLAENDSKSDVRTAAVDALILFFNKKVELALLKNAAKDSSYLVVSAAIEAIYDKDKTEGIAIASHLESLDDASIQLSIAEIYANDGAQKYDQFFKKNLKKLDTYSKYPLMISYTDYLLLQEDSVILAALPSIEKVGSTEEVWWVRMSAVSALASFNNMYSERLAAFKKMPDRATESFKIPAEEIEAKKMKEKVLGSLRILQQLETDQNVKRMIESELK